MSYLKSTALVFTLLTLAFSTAYSQKETGSVKGNVRTLNNKKISGVLITARQDGKDSKSIRTNRNGKFRLRGLAPGVYNLVFEKEGYSLGILYGVEIRRKKVNKLKKALILEVDQGTLVIVLGSVFDQAGFSIYGAKVKVVEIRDGKPFGKTRTLHTGRDGSFVYRNQPGQRKFLITASAKGAKSSKTIDVNEPAIYRLAVTVNLPEKANKKA